MNTPNNEELEEILLQLQTGTLYAENVEPAMTNNRKIATQAIKQLISNAEREARIDEWRCHVLGEDFEKFYPTDRFDDFIKVPSFHITKRLKELNDEPNA